MHSSELEKATHSVAEEECKCGREDQPHRIHRMLVVETVKDVMSLGSPVE